MAVRNGNSGTFNIYTKNNAISGYVAWQETYDDSNYSKTNETTVTMDVYLHRTNIYSGETSVQGVAGTRIAYFGSEEVRDDSNLYLAIAGNSSSSGGAYTKVYSASMPIKHNDDGSKTITLGYYMTNNWVGGSAGNAFAVDKTTADVTLMKVPRYGTCSQSLNRATETTITMNWSSDNVVDYVWYSTDWGGSWRAVGSVNAKSGTYTIDKNSRDGSELSPDATYNIMTKIRRKDSQLETASSNLGIKTYDYPYCIESPNFVIGDELTLKFYNPLGRLITIYVIGDNGEEIGGAQTGGTSISGYKYDGMIEWWYRTIPAKPVGKYKVKVVYGNSKKISDLGGTYYIKPEDCRPTFNDFNYTTNLSRLTGNNDTIINGKTTTQLLIPVAKKASGYQGAWIVKYRFECGTQKKEIEESSSEVSASFSYCNSSILKVTAIDSRGQERAVLKNVLNFKDYTPPVFASNKIERKNGIDVETNLSATINFWNGDFGNGNNKITSLSYRTKKREDSDYSNWQTINLENVVTKDGVATLEEYLIHANGQNGGFEIGVSYNVQVQVSDGLDTYTLSNIISGEILVTDGKVGFSLLKDSDGNYHIGIDGMPDTKAPLFVKGKNPTVAVSASEPTTGENLWIKKSKNMFNINGNVNIRENDGVEMIYNTVSNGVLTAGVNTAQTHGVGQKFTNLEGKTFTVSAKVISIGSGSHGYLTISENGRIVKQINIALNQTASLTYTANSDNIVVAFATASGTNAQFTNIQVELGSVATAFEPLVIDEIHTKNTDNDYEKLTDTLNIGESPNKSKMWIQKAKNYFDMKKMTFLNPNAVSFDSIKNIVTLNTYYNEVKTKLKDIAPDLVAGVTYIINAETTSAEKYIYLHGSGYVWPFGTPRTLSQAELDGTIAVYGMDDKTTYISNITIEEGDKLTKKLFIQTDDGSFEEFVDFEEINKINYSTREQRIGTWIDGKPLYRRVLYSTKRVESGAGYMPDTAIPNIDVVTDVDVTIGSFGYASFKSHWTAGSYSISTQFDKDSGLYINATYTGFIGWVLKVEYTKTTD